MLFERMSIEEFEERVKQLQEEGYDREQITEKMRFDVVSYVFQLKEKGFDKYKIACALQDKVNDLNVITCMLTAYFTVKEIFNTLHIDCGWSLDRIACAFSNIRVSRYEVILLLRDAAKGDTEKLRQILMDSGIFEYDNIFYVFELTREMLEEHGKKPEEIADMLEELGVNEYRISDAMSLCDKIYEILWYKPLATIKPFLD
jgi:hypothetical protein